MKKKALITGATGNLGKATVQRFIADGYTVIATVTPGKSLDFPVDGELYEYEINLTDEQSVNSVIQKIISEHSTLDAALLLVGGFAPGNVKNTDGSALRKMLSLNFDTTYFVARPVFNHMITQPAGGKLIFIGARPAIVPKDGKNAIAYALSKSLVFKLADFLNEEGSSKNVTASVIVPSTIDTDPNRKAMPDKDFTAWVKPEEIADVMAFVCSDSGNALRDTVIKVYNRA